MDYLLSSDFMPHGYCYLWDPWIVWLHVVSDSLITLAYYCIPVVLVYFIRKQRDLGFNRIFWMFAVFILACGTTHFMEVWNIWHASYLLAGILKAITAGASVATALALMPLIPKILSLREAQMGLAAIFESSIDAIIGKDLDGIVTSWNTGAERPFGYSAAEMIGRPISLLVPPDRQQEEIEILNKVRRGESVASLETIRIRKDGTQVEVSDSVSLVMDASGKVVGASKIARDITERKRAEADLLKQKKELSRSNRDLEQFAYAASHDLQEPLRAVAGCVHLLQQRYQNHIDARADELIAHTVDGATRMQKLIDDLLTFSRVNTHGGELQSVPSRHAVEAALQNLSVAVRKNAAEVNLGELPEVVGDISQLTLLFQNLMANALKFHGPQAPRIRIGPGTKAANGSFPSMTMASESNRNTLIVSSSSSSACIPERSIPAPAWAWPFARKSWSVTADGFGSNLKREMEPLSFSPFSRPQRQISRRTRRILVRGPRGEGNRKPDRRHSAGRG